MSAPKNRTPLWNVTYQRNPFFTGREEVLNQLQKGLREENAVALSHPQGISGLGGIGKTQTAIEYAYRYHSDYHAVFWLKADSSGTLTLDFISIAHLLNLREKDEQDQQVIVDAVMQWLRTHTHWLLIFDN